MQYGFLYGRVAVKGCATRDDLMAALLLVPSTHPLPIPAFTSSSARCGRKAQAAGVSRATFDAEEAAA